jgi:hypothetical protein
MNPPDSQSPAEMQGFFTRERANEGVLLPLSQPDGSKTEHWIRIRGVDSDDFRRAEAAAKRKAVTDFGDITDKDRLQEQVFESMRELVAHLVISWSFSIPCTLENVKKFLREAPQIAEEIDLLASRRRLFFKQGSANSTTTPEGNSS